MKYGTASLITKKKKKFKDPHLNNSQDTIKKVEMLYKTMITQ